MTGNQDTIANLLTPDHVDMSQLTPPTVIETLSFETIFQELLADFVAKKPDYDALLESDPAIIALECAAYRELLLRQRINEAAKSCMLAYATGTDLDNLAAFYGIVRQADETDERLRYRTQLSLEAFTTAGSEKSYLFHTLSADPRVKSASVQTPSDGRVLISIMSYEDNGTASDELIEIVNKYVSSEDKRPLTDHVTIQSAKLEQYKIQAKIYMYYSPSMTVTEQECRAALDKYVEKHSTIGNYVASSGIFDALHTEGVQKVELSSPAADIATTKEQAPVCTEINIEFVIADDTNQ